MLIRWWIFTDSFFSRVNWNPYRNAKFPERLLQRAERCQVTRAHRETHKLVMYDYRRHLNFIKTPTSVCFKMLRYHTVICAISIWYNKSVPHYASEIVSFHFVNARYLPFIHSFLSSSMLLYIVCWEACVWALKLCLFHFFLFLCVYAMGPYQNQYVT